MNTASEIKARRAALTARRRELEGLLADAEPGARRRLRIELAGTMEDIADCNQRLRELMPRHRVSVRTTWAGADGFRWDQMQYKTWAELEGAEEPEGPTAQEQMGEALRKSGGALTSKQAEYLSAVGQGRRAAEIARATGVNRSTVCRTLHRARERLRREATALYEAGRLAGGERLDLSDPEQLSALLNLLTPRQQMYLCLYYGEWLSLREIGALLAVDHASVLRGIRRGLERLAKGLGQETRIVGTEALEDLLMSHYNDLPPEIWQTPRKHKKRAPCTCPQNRKGAEPGGEGPGLRGTVRWDAGTGRLRDWLAERLKEARAAGGDDSWRSAGRRLLTLLFQLVKRSLSRQA